MSKFRRYSWLLCIFFAVACNSIEKKNTNEPYFTEINNQREIKNLEFADSLSTPLNKTDFDVFTSLNYFAPNAEYLLTAGFRVDTSTAVFGMKTTTDRLPNYRIYGFAEFILRDTLCILTVFQNVDYKDDAEYGNTLFIPFRDATNGKQTYKTGRYVDIPIPDTDSILIDFNLTYNPYCAYDSRWSCPLVPKENWLKIAILAGEMNFK